MRRKQFAQARARLRAHSIPELTGLMASADLQTRFLAEMRLRDVTQT